MKDEPHQIPASHHHFIHIPKHPLNRSSQPFVSPGQHNDLRTKKRKNDGQAVNVCTTGIASGTNFSEDYFALRTSLCCVKSNRTADIDGI